jgi:putative oxidoreductase
LAILALTTGAGAAQRLGGPVERVAAMLARGADRPDFPLRDNQLEPCESPPHPGAMVVVFLASRLLLAMVFIGPGIQVHLVERRSAVALARAAGAPLPAIMVPLAGVATIAGGLMIATGIWADVGALLVAAFAIGVLRFMHAFWTEAEAHAVQNQIAHFSKNVGLAAGALAIPYVHGERGDDAPLSLGSPVLVG